MMEATYRQVPNIEVERDEGSLAVCVDETRWAVLEGTSIEIWEELRRPCSVTALVNALKAKFDFDPAAAQLEIQTTIDLWLDNGLIEKA